MTLLATRETESKSEFSSASRSEMSSPSEIVVLCPRCKALQTLQIAGGRLTPTRKFTQGGAHIYHDCGSVWPCRLYQNL